jgi:hypothetical protein
MSLHFHPYNTQTLSLKIPHQSYLQRHILFIFKSYFNLLQFPNIFNTSILSILIYFLTKYPTKTFHILYLIHIKINNFPLFVTYTLYSSIIYLYRHSILFFQLRCNYLLFYLSDTLRKQINFYTQNNSFLNHIYLYFTFHIPIRFFLYITIYL